MPKPMNALDAVLSAMPAVQEQVRPDIAACVVAGETVAGRDQSGGDETGRRTLDQLCELLAGDEAVRLPNTAPIARQLSAA
jgi:hypothetical protein